MMPFIPNLLLNAKGSVPRVINWELIGEDAIVWDAANPLQLISQKKVYNGTLPNSDMINNPSVGGMGKSWTGVSTNTGVDFGTNQPLSSNTEFSGLVWSAPENVAASRHSFSQRYGTSPFPLFVLGSANISDINTVGAGYWCCGTNGGAAAARSVSAANQVDGLLHCWVSSNSTTKGYIYRDGAKQTLFKDERITGTVVSANQKLKVGASADSTAVSGNTNPLLLIVAWPRQIPEELARYLSANPGAVFKSNKNIGLSLFTAPISGITLTGADASQANASTTGAIGQTHVLAGANVSQTNASTTDAISQTYILTGANSDQTNNSSTGAISISGTITLTGADASQSNGSTTGSISQTHVLTGADVSQVNASNTGAVGQTHILIGADASQTNAATSGAISFPAAMVLTQADIDAITNAVWAKAIETLRADEMMRVMFAALAGKREGIGTATERYMGVDGVTPRVTFTPDGNGNGTPTINGSL